MADVVTVTLPAGTRVTCSKDTAERQGLKEAEAKAPAKKKSSRKS